MNELTVINPETGEITQWRDDTQEIIGLPIRLDFDVRQSKPAFYYAGGEEKDISGRLISSTFLYACWSEMVGKPLCMGVGKLCPDHPDHSQPGIGLVLETDQIGVVYMQCWGLLEKWAKGLIRRASKEDGYFCTDGTRDIPTQHGTMKQPRLK